MTYPRVNCLKTIPFTAAHPYIAHIWEYPLPPGAERSASRYYSYYRYYDYYSYYSATATTGIIASTRAQRLQH